MRPRTSLIPALSCAAVIASVLAARGEPLVRSGDTIVFLGDSITHYGVERSHGYVNLTVQGLAANGIDVRDAVCSADWVKAEFDQASASFLSASPVTDISGGGQAGRSRAVFSID